MKSLRKSLSMGMLCALVGLVTGALVARTATGSGYGWFVVAAPLAAFATGTFLWWLLVARRTTPSTMAGVLTGALAGAVGHYVCWLFMILGATTCNALTGGCTDSLGGPPMSVLQAFPAAGVYSFFSLLFFGWLTIPGGAILGGFLARAQGRAALAVAAP
jgi:hypothetical protein